MATPLAPKEYVRQQLASMGITMLSEEELESYTRDFSRLIQEHVDEGSSSDLSDLSSLSETTPISVETTPITRHPPPPLPGSAVFKTFPGNKENKVQLLPPSPSANSFSLSPDKHGGVSLLSTGTEEEGGPATVRANRGPGRTVRRKVLRKCNGESRVFDESMTSSAPNSPVRGASSHLSELSLVSTVTDDSTEGSVRSEGRRPHTCKSFIRVPLVPPHLRGLKKSDPVSRYHEFHRLWEAQKPPGEKNRDRLRWHIRFGKSIVDSKTKGFSLYALGKTKREQTTNSLREEQLLQQDVPYFEPRRRPRLNELIPPPDKKRTAAVSWTIGP